MIELILVCALTVGDWTPPEAWKLEKVVVGKPYSTDDATDSATTDFYTGSITWGYGNSCPKCKEPEYTVVHLRRKVRSGDKIRIPPWCGGAKQTMRQVE
jgi:hypothetical protein